MNTKVLEVPTAELERVQSKLGEVESYLLALYSIVHLTVQVRDAQISALLKKDAESAVEAKRIEKVLDNALAAFFRSGN